MIRIKRAYDAASPDDGDRLLVDRLWPRGITKEALHIDGWHKDVAPSDKLRHWFAHDPKKWPEFRRRYFAEMDASPAAWEPLLEAAKHRDVTLLYAARDTDHNNAVALRDYLTERHGKAVKQAHAASPPPTG